MTDSPCSSACCLASSSPNCSAVHRSKRRLRPAVAAVARRSAFRLASTSSGVLSSMSATLRASSVALSICSFSASVKKVPRCTTLSGSATPISESPTRTFRPSQDSERPGTKEASQSESVATSAPIALLSTPKTQCLTSSRRSSARSSMSVPGDAALRRRSIASTTCGRGCRARKRTVRSASTSVTCTRKCALPHAGSTTAKESR